MLLSKEGFIFGHLIYMYIQMNYFRYFTLGCMLWCASLLTLQAGVPEHINFSHISIDDGLSQSTVFDIAQDTQGNMWFATYDGVNKYNGYNFNVYRHKEGDPATPANDIARVVKVDSQGRVWIGTRSGLSYYNREKDKFENYYIEKDGKRLRVNDIAEVSPDELLISTKEGLQKFDITTRQFNDHCYSVAMHTTVATKLYRHGDYIYIGTSGNGIFCYDLQQKSFEKLSAMPDGKSVQDILLQSATRMWVATEGDGLFLIDPKSNEVKQYLHHPQQANSISSNYIRSLALDAQGRLWIGTFNELNIYHEGTNSFTSYGSSPTEAGSLSQQSVRSIFMDNQGGMWLGTYFGGLNYYHPIRNRFNNLQRIPYKNSLSDEVVSCIIEDAEENLWIGTNDGGLNHYNTKTKHYTHYTVNQDINGGMASNNVKALYIDEANSTIYIGSHAGGLSIAHRGSTRVTHYNSSNSDLPDDNVYAILPDGTGSLLLGTLNGLVHYTPRQNKFVTLTLNRSGAPVDPVIITNLYRDSKQRLWVSGEEGIAVYRQHGTDIEPIRLLPEGSSLKKAFTNCVHEASGGNFYIGTREGLFHFNEEKNTLQTYTTEEGLPNNVIYGILEDTYGRLWLSTNRGISCFDPQKKSFRSFTNADGLQSNQFTNAAYCRAHDGQMYFGGIKGITTFRPELLLDNPYAPPVVITRLQLFNQTVLPDDETGILTRNISETDKITLTPSQNSITLNFVVSNYISGQHNTFAYKLEGFDKEWYEVTNTRRATYSNLPQGHYRFMVKAANNDGRWNNTPTVLEIVVLPVWYRTWWAILLFILLLAGITISVFRYSWLRKSMKAELEWERRDKEHQEEINQMKMRFFINISHELRTPLTLIMAPLQEVISRINDRWTRNQLEYIQRNANRLLHLVNQLMDYRRAELGVFELKVKYDNAHRLVQENFLFYDKLARHKGITYTFHSDLGEREELFDAQYLELILNNLLSNAFKYTGQGKSITVTLSLRNNDLLLQVADTGQGIPINKQAKIFERFYQVESQHIGSGIGLSLVQRLVDLHHGRIELESAEGQGSTFSVYLPQDEIAYKPNEWAAAQSEETEQRVHTTNAKEMYFIDTVGNEHPEVEAEEKKRGTILIVEDNEEIRRYLRDGLAGLFNILQAVNGEKALELLKEQEADIVVTDVMMPVMDGIKLCKNLKQNIRTCHIPVLMLSAKSDVKDQLEGLQMGADDYIAKPFSLAVLTTKIQNMMRTRMHMLERYNKTLEVEPEKVTFNAMDEALMKRAVAIVTKNMDNISFSTDEFAREMGMSRSNLHLKLKAITGESAIEFIRKVRFGEASRLLKEGRYTVSEVSVMVGFNTPSYFATSFKKYFGCLPTEYVKKIKEQSE